MRRKTPKASGGKPEAGSIGPRLGPGILVRYCKRGRIVNGYELHAVVALTEDLPEHGLVRGQVGTVVECWAPDVYEVEFSDDRGMTYAMAAVKDGQLMRLYHQPVHEAA